MRTCNRSRDPTAGGPQGSSAKILAVPKESPASLPTSTQAPYHPSVWHRMHCATGIHKSARLQRPLKATEVNFERMRMWPLPQISRAVNP